MPRRSSIANPTSFTSVRRSSIRWLATSTPRLRGAGEDGRRERAPLCVLRPTLMFGWFDRKHLGWLARFMQRAPRFPMPGDGRFLRQPLYVGDFCDIIISCIEKPSAGQDFNISGQEKIDYIDLIKASRRRRSRERRSSAFPTGLFWLLLKTYALVDRIRRSPQINWRPRDSGGVRSHRLAKNLRREGDASG